MNKYLISLFLLLFCGMGSYAQSIKFGDVVYLATLNNDEAFDNLQHGSIFKQDYAEDMNGQQVEHFKNVKSKPGTEEITFGAYTKLSDGTVLRTVAYTSTDSQYIINMIAQAKHYGLTLRFRGVDNSNNIYLFDNDFYQVSIYLRRDQSSGLVEVKQKEYINLD